VGYSSFWEQVARQQRVLDVLFTGKETPRNAVKLASYAGSLWRWRSALYLTDELDVAPNGLAGSVKDAPAALRRAAKVVLNLHPGSDRTFDWLYGVLAIMSGCALVSEHAADHE